VATPSSDDGPPPGPDALAPPAPGRLHGADAVRLHTTLVVGLSICVAAFIFEVMRALGGNSLSWAYVFEWPIFAVFAIYMWWNLLHGTDGSRRNPARRRGSEGRDGGATSEPARSGGAPSGPDDPALRAWQEYLRKLDADESDRVAGHGTD